MRWIAAAVLVAACQQPSRLDELPHIEFVEAPPFDDLAGLVRTEQRKAQRDGKRLLVYVGASWCEPCRRFHEAAAVGALDDQFGRVRLLEFDYDRHLDALHRAGYRSELIPLFALPNPDGTASGQQIEGSIKGDGAVAQITPRLQALLDR
jgi:thiol-disulfide isomerase/thioredoxin